YVQRSPDGTFSNAFEALIAINCLDDPGPQDLTFPERFAAELKAVSPRFGEWGAYSYTCIDWPAPAVTPMHLDAKGADPIVVVGTTGDPVTPLESSRALAEALDQGVLVTVQAERHTGYGVNGCIVRTVDDYLIDLVVPPAGVVCK
ncbi:MAG TPA: alpha/beta hydrolase, partial [Acidimicrobiales bacterium]